MSRRVVHKMYSRRASTHFDPRPQRQRFREYNDEYPSRPTAETQYNHTTPVPPHHMVLVPVQTLSFRHVGQEPARPKLFPPESEWELQHYLQHVNPPPENADEHVRVVYLYSVTYSKSMDQPGKVAHPARGQLNRENEYFPVPVRAREFGL